MFLIYTYKWERENKLFPLESVNSKALPPLYSIKESSILYYEKVLNGFVHSILVRTNLKRY